MQTVPAPDLAVVRRVFTASYTVREGSLADSIRCTSRNGLRLPNGDDDEHAWRLVKSALNAHFGARLLEVAHNISTWYSDFTIYLAAPTPPTIKETTPENLNS